MKQIIVKLLVCILILLPLSCSDTEDGSYVEPITIYEKVNGTWSLQNLTMVDEFAKANAIKPDEQDLSALFNYENFQIKLNTDESFKPTTYEVLGEIPPLFEPNGYWNLNSSFQPTNSGDLIMYLYSDAEKTKLTDELKITSVPGSNNLMQIKLIRKSGGIPFVSYNFKLTTAN